jgi:membrane-bound acyltransferase YfiQ involved in biofilm formation
MEVRVTPNIFSINGAIGLFPHFLLGVLFFRSMDFVHRHRTPLVILGATLIFVATVVNIAVYAETGALSTRQRDLQSLCFATGGCILAMLALPRLPQMGWFGAVSLTVYLYHVFGTSAARRALHLAGIDDVAVHIVLGVAAGFAVPIALHLLARRHALTRLVFLGLRQPAPAGQGALPEGPPHGGVRATLRRGVWPKENSTG